MLGGKSSQRLIMMHLCSGMFSLGDERTLVDSDTGVATLERRDLVVF